MGGNGHGNEQQVAPSMPNQEFGRLLAGLRPKQAEFVRQYLVDRNATQAAIRAGYSPRGAEVQGHRLLRNAKIRRVQKLIEAALARKTDVTAAGVIRELGRLGFSDMRDFMAWGPKGLKLKDSKELTEDQARAIAQVKETRKVIARKGREPIVETTLTFKLHSKQPALDALGKALGVFEKTEPSVDQDVLLKAVVAVFMKFLPPDQHEPACIELGRAVDAQALSVPLASP